MTPQDREVVQAMIAESNKVFLETINIPTPNQAIALGERVRFRGGKSGTGDWVVVGICDVTSEGQPIILCHPVGLPGYRSDLQATAFPLRDAVRPYIGRCPCCKAPFSEIVGGGAIPCIDHDHMKGLCREAVRGIICSRCNLILGHADDSIKILEACIRHLKRLS